MVQFDVIIRGGTVVTAADTMQCDVGVKDGKIAALGLDLGDADREIDASGRLVLPGGIDSHPAPSFRVGVPQNCRGHVGSVGDGLQSIEQAHCLYLTEIIGEPPKLSPQALGAERHVRATRKAFRRPL